MHAAVTAGERLKGPLEQRVKTHGRYRFRALKPDMGRVPPISNGGVMVFPHDS